MSAADIGYYDRLHRRLMAEGLSAREALAEVAEAYLDASPQKANGHKMSRSNRDNLFWTSACVQVADAQDWQGEAMGLALTRYLAQDKIAVPGLLDALAQNAPAVLTAAVRHSGLVLRPDSPRHHELQQAAAHAPDVAELCRVLHIFEEVHALRREELARCQSPFGRMSVVELLAWASLYAFEHLVPHDLHGQAPLEAGGTPVTSAWDAINELLLWKLRTGEFVDLRLDENDIAEQVGPLFRDWLFSMGPPPEQLALRHAEFQALMVAQIEMLEFMSRSIGAFCWDDSIRFKRRGDRLEIVETDPAARAAWQRNTRKLWQLHGYWLDRAVDAFARSDMAHRRIGRPENEDDNRLAWIKALAARMRLSEVYGVGDQVSIEGGRSINLFQALLSQELTSIFFLRDYVGVFAAQAQVEGHWRPALRHLALQGLLDGMQNRLPFTWSDREKKVRRILGWTVTPEQPQGSATAAQAILDFWCYDMVELAERLGRGEPGLHPRLFERPVLRFGGAYVQLPWVGAFQSNGHAAINNLRRLGARRAEAREETQRIDVSLAAALQARGFRVLVNWQPPADFREAGEVDVVAARDGHLFLFELKSTFVRESAQDAWLHLSTTLRKAGRQLVRKQAAVLSVLTGDTALQSALGLQDLQADGQAHAWIVDTSIEGDHCFFSDCLKLSLEEILIALRDDRRHLFDGQVWTQGQPAARQPAATLYPAGFDAVRFVDVIQSQAVWNDE